MQVHYQKHFSIVLTTPLCLRNMDLVMWKGAMPESRTVNN